MFDRLIRHVEEILFIFLITGEPARSWERNFAGWAKELRKVDDKASFESFIKSSIDPIKVNFTERFDDAFQRFSYSSMQKYRLRYILAKLTQHIEIKAYGETEVTKSLKNYTDNYFEIEHIFPQNPSDRAAEEFGEFEDQEIANRLGNLVLVEKPINASLGNKPYSEKCTFYPKSKLLLTHALAERPQIGCNTKIDRAVANLNPFEKWNEDAVKQRQGELTELARSIWGLPERG